MVPAKNVHHLVHQPGWTKSKSDLDANGFLIGEIVNLDAGCTTLQLKIPPHGVLYWIARKNNAGGYESQIVGFGHDPISTNAATFKHCPEDRQHKTTHEDINHKSLAEVCGGRFLHTAEPLNRGPFASDDVIWVACDLGCCYADDLPEKLKLTQSPK
jgi:hypothetical protein